MQEDWSGISVKETVDPCRYVTAAQSLIQIRVGPLYWLVSHYTEKRIDKYSFSNTCTCIAGSMFTNWNSKIRKISEIPGLYLIFIHCKIRSVLGCFLHEYTVKFVMLINQFKLVYVTMKNLFSMYNLTLYRKMQVFFFFILYKYRHLHKSYFIPWSWSGVFLFIHKYVCTMYKLIG